MTVTAQMVKELREKSGAGMLDCKKALEETNGDVNLAMDYLREKGISKALKKADRIAAEGLANVVVKGNEAVVYEVNSETDFVSKNKQFLDLIEIIGETLINSKAKNTEEAFKVDVKGKTLETVIAEASATIGEKITLRRVTRVSKKAAEGFGAYKHMGGRIAVLSVISKDNAEVSKDIAMHIAANAPRFLDKTKVDKETLAHETKILKEQALEENNTSAKPKPVEIVEKIVAGRVSKFLQEICLEDQPFVKNPDIKVSEYVKQNGTQIIDYIRLEVGEGIEKKEEDFAAEVAAQMKK